MFRLLFIPLLFLCACRPAKVPISPTPPQAKIGFFSFEISRTEGAPTIKLVQEIVVPGKLKVGADQSVRRGQVGDLEVSFLDQEGRELRQVPVGDPLNEFVEYVEEDGSLQRKAVSHQRAIFEVRLQLPPRARQLSVSVYLEDDSLLRIFTSNISS